MDFDFTRLPPRDRYRLLTNFVGPRPIALVTTRAAAGHDNAAPMSFFNVFSHEPPIVILGLQGREGVEKDTTSNIRRTGEFVVNMVDMALSDAMIVCSASFPPEVDEIRFAGLTPVPARQVASTRIGESPCAFECRVERIIDWPNRAIVLGEVVEMHVRDNCLDPAGRYVEPARYQPIARLHADNYITSDRQFVLSKPEHLLAHEIGGPNNRADT